MKKIIFILATVLTSSFVSAQKFDLKSTFGGLKSEVDSVVISQYKGEELNYTSTYIYSQKGHLTAVRVHTKDTHTEISYKLDSIDRPLELNILTTKNADHSILSHSKTEYTYTDDNNWSALALDKVSGSMLYNEVGKANGYSASHSIQRVAPDGTSKIIRRSFDKHGNMLFDKYFNENDVWTNAEHMAYNQSNLVIRREYTATGMVKRIEYLKYTENDDKGNWVKREITEKGKPELVEKQTIYYRD